MTDHRETTENRTVWPWQRARSTAIAAMLMVLTAWPGTGAHAQALRFDSDASRIGVVFRQMGVDVEAAFKRFAIDARFDPSDPGATRADVTIETASFDFGPGAEEYNEEVRAPDWFDTKQFPTASFRVTGVRPAGDNKYGVVGDLTIKGVTRSVSTDFDMTRQGSDVALTGRLPISRLAYNVGQGDWKDTSIVEDTVQIVIRLIARPQK